MAKAKGYPIGNVQLQYLLALEEAGGALITTKVGVLKARMCRRAGVAQGTFSIMVRTLEEQGYITTLRSESGRFTLGMELTDKGRLLLQTIRSPVLPPAMPRLVAPINQEPAPAAPAPPSGSDEERANVIAQRMFDRLVTYIKAHDDLLERYKFLEEKVEKLESERHKPAPFVMDVIKNFE